MNPKDLLPRDGMRIAVIGGGPAGSFFALNALRISREKGIDCKITILNGKDFERPGPAGCNMCAGVISETLYQKLTDWGIEIPEEVVQSKIEGYVLETRFLKYPLLHPLREKKIHTVFRGSGPISSSDTGIVSFDSYLLNLARDSGAEILNCLVNSISLPEEDTGKITLACSRHSEQFHISADMIVGASGLNSTLAEKFSNLHFGYRLPKSLKMYQAELEMDPQKIRSIFGNRIFIFSLGIKNIQFAAMTPKARYITLSIITKGNARKEDMSTFLSHPKIREKFSKELHVAKERCFCLPKINIASSRKPYADRIVIIGDASISRYYKNGIESAFLSAQLAGEAIFHHGYSEKALKKHYFYPLRKQIGNDNRYGHLLFKIFDLISTYGSLAQIFLLVASKSKRDKPRQIAQEILWDLFTGNNPYKNIFFKFLKPDLQFELIKTTLLYHFNKRKRKEDLLNDGKENQVITSNRSRLGPLKSGQNVAIIGGGPAGISCAISLKNLAAQKGSDIEVFLYEGKKFAGGKHYNQCAGVLSPPIKEILENFLQVPFPHHLVQKVINGYILHTDSNRILLDEQGEPAFALRRITFDEYMMDEAKKRGVNIINARITDLEFNEDSVRIYSESGYGKADVVVGAFGLDDGSTKLMESTTKYKAPRYLKTVVTKIHPRKDFMEKFGTRIHAFLPSIKEIEFGGIVPKGNHITVIIAGESVTSQSLDAFFEHPEVRSVLPENLDDIVKDLYYFKGKFPISLASRFYGNRYICLGDSAGLVRPFKGKGINSGFMTGYHAAKVMMEYGISKRRFSHFREGSKEIQDDLIYGRVLRRLAKFASNRKLIDPILNLAEREPAVKLALFNCVSAHKNFKEIYKDSISFKTLSKAILAVATKLFH
jgi:flavin-dependent dehydrogenase